MKQCLNPPARSRVPAAALLVSGLLMAGCGTAAEPVPAAAPTAAPASAPTAAPRTTALGGPASACPLPVTFAVPEGWKPKKVELPKAPELTEFAELLHRGPATMRCEIDAKPAGHIGFLRVWTAEGRDARTVPEGFVKAEENASAARYDPAPPAKVTYTVRSALTEEAKEESAFAVSTPEGTVLVHLGGFDTDEHRAMLPAFELAAKTLKVR